MFKVTMDFDPDDFEKLVMDATIKAIEREVGGVRCPQHGEYAQIQLTKTEDEKLTFDVKACCKNLQQEVEKKLKGGEEG